MSFVQECGNALLMAAAMAYQVAWSLVLGFVISGVIQAVVSKEMMQRQLGRSGPRELFLATFYGAISSSCSYAAAAMSRTIFKKGAAFAPSLAFLFASTNLVIELGLILIVLMGWQFAAAEWIGGVMLVAIMAVLVKLTYPARLVEEARTHVETGGGHEHGSDIVEGATVWDRLRNPQTRIVVAQNVAMDWSMLRDDLLVGFLVAGSIAVFVPASVWHALFFTGSAPWVQTIAGTIVGALIAIFTFVCSIGNVPMAAVLWSMGLPFGGTLSFLYADLIVLPLLDVYRKYYGWKTALYIFCIFFVTMVLSALAMDGLFHAFNAVPLARPDASTLVEHFSLNYTFWLNLIALGAVIAIVAINRRHPMDHHHHHDHDHDHHDHDHHDHDHHEHEHHEHEHHEHEHCEEHA
jgi:uncharacterized membrane protein YraQ (UPF0718 family)